MYPSGVAGVSGRRVTIAGGLSLRAIESGPADGHPVVLVHGFGASVYTFAEMIPVLAAAGFRVIALDLPGHGLSDKPTGNSAYSTRALGEAVLAAATALGVSRFTMIGHSMGGALGLDLALRGTGALDGVVLISSAALGHVFGLALVKVFSPGLVDRFVPALLTRRLVQFVLGIAFATPERPHARDVDEYWAPTQFAEFAWACRSCVHQVTWKRESSARLRGLRLPVLVIAGGRDRLVRGVAERARLIPNATIVKIAEGGHVVLQECAARTNEEVLRFLKALAGGGPRGQD